MHHHLRTYLPLQADRRLQADWLPNMDNIPVVPPHRAGEAGLHPDAVVGRAGSGHAKGGAAHTAVQRVDALLGPMVDAEYTGRLQSFSTTGTDAKLPDDVSNKEEPPLPSPSYVGH